MLLDQLDNIWSAAAQFFDLCTTYSIKQQNTIQIYNLANAADVTRFKPYEDTFLNLLKAAYGNKLYEREVHLNRIYGRGHSFGAHYVFLAFSKGIKIDSVTGCSYIRPDGKRGATAVLPQYQGRGIGRQLICASLKLFDKQFTEISPSDLRMKRLLMSLGFQVVTSESELKHNLGKAAHLLRSIRYQDHYILYTRSIPACQYVERELLMFTYHQE
jgi:GNAT superfamily N-acetyltransferase